ncbi:DUF1304 domain-containing protein [Luteococcus sanguinis]|uniref:DUF1304 domain-containing protein n=1 Tax=Luteococcus sanguinis TaxID=174038 RepID=A0ABW1X4L2_9ACTN
MFIAAAVFVALAVLLHVYIWYLESFAWTTKARAVFGTGEQEALATQEMAFNQGFYNLFLALIALAGLLVAGGSRGTGIALMLAGTGSMLAAAALLFATSPDKRSAAIKQGVCPLLAVGLLVLVQ